MIRQIFCVVVISQAVGLLAGCNSVPADKAAYRQALAPALDGVLRDDDAPLRQRKLALARNEGRTGVCERPLKQFYTNDAGRFSVEALLKERGANVPDRLENDWQLCLWHNGSYVQLWYRSHVGVLAGNSAVEIDCNVDAVTLDRISCQARPTFGADDS